MFLKAGVGSVIHIFQYQLIHLPSLLFPPRRDLRRHHHLPTLISCTTVSSKRVYPCSFRIYMQCNLQQPEPETTFGMKIRNSVILGFSLFYIKVMIRLKVVPGCMLESVLCRWGIFFQRLLSGVQLSHGPLWAQKQRAYTEGKIEQKCLSLLDSRESLGGNRLWLRLALENIRPLPWAWVRRRYAPVWPEMKAKVCVVQFTRAAVF